MVLAATLVAYSLPGGAAEQPLPEVTVTATRSQLQARVTKFVDQIAIAENAEGLARWDVPSVCPFVSGLPQHDSDFIRDRLQQIGRVAGVPLADNQPCSPNLYVLVTATPQDLLRGMEKRNRPFTFGYDSSTYPPVETPAGVVDEFIATPRAVRVWYNPIEKDRWGQPLAYCRASDTFAKCAQNPHQAACDPNQYYRCGRSVAGGSHLEFNTIWIFSRVFVIVDQGQLQGVTREQLADYVAMVGFAKLKPGTNLSDAPTILKLFDGAPRAAPAGITDWDQTFLKSLYSTAPTSRVQRGEIARAMVRDLVR